MQSYGSLASAALRKQIELRQADAHVDEELQRCKARFAYFLMRYVKTVDEHDPSSFAKAIPRLVYLREIADLLQREPRIAIEKSRQLMISWICISYVLWHSLFHANVLFFIQSKKSEDAAALLDRCYQIYHRLPGWMRERFPINLGSGRPGMPLFSHLYFTWRTEDEKLFGYTVEEGMSFKDLVSANATRSHIFAVPQGSDQIRQFTATGLFSDEAAYQTEANEAYTAAVPAMAPDSKMIFVSSAAPGFFESLCRDVELR